MIFVTVGSQMPFDRLVRAVDEWAAARGRSDVFAQIGPTDWRPAHIAWETFIEPAEFRRRMETADVIVAHAGMGSILTALELGKPILVMPRQGALRETRNDHQLATALKWRDRIAVATDERELAVRLDALAELRPSERISSGASPELIEAIRSFIFKARAREPLAEEREREPSQQPAAVGDSARSAAALGEHSS